METIGALVLSFGAVFLALLADEAKDGREKVICIFLCIIIGALALYGWITIMNGS